MKFENHPDGTVTISFPEPTKAQQVFAIWWEYLHEGHFEFQEGAHPSWKGHREETLARMKAITDTMSDEEKRELWKRMSPPGIPYHY